MSFQSKKTQLIDSPHARRKTMGISILTAKHSGEDSAIPHRHPNPKIRELKDGKTHHLGGPNPGGASRLATAAKVTERLAPQLAAQQIHSPI